MHQEKVQQEKLKAVKARLNFEEVSQHSESGTPSREGTTEKGSNLNAGLERGMFHRVLAQEEWNLLLRNIIVEEHPRAGQKQCQKVKIVHEDIGNQVQRSKDQGLRVTIYPNHSYDDLKKAFLANFLQQKKCIKDLVEIHHIKQREGESMEDFVQRFKTKSRNVKGAPECMRISRFMHSITNPELIKLLHDNISKSVDKMIREPGRKQNFDKRGDFQNQQRSKRRRDKFTLLTKSLREILALDKGKFKAPPPMTTPVKKRNSNKFCEFHGEVGRNTDESNSSKKGRDIWHGQGYGNPDGATMAEDRIMQSFSPDLPPLGEEDGMEGPMINEAKIGGHFINRIYVDGGSSSEILYEHCFKRLRPEVKNQMVPATTPLIGFSGEVIWLMGQISLPVKIGDAEHSTSTWMNFMVVRSPSLYNRIIGRPGVRKIQAVPSTAHEMLKFPVPRGVLTLWSSRIISLECVMVSGPEAQSSNVAQTMEERIKIAIHPEYPEQTITIGSTLTEEGPKALCNLLRHNLDILVWKLADMIGGSRLSIYLYSNPNTDPNRMPLTKAKGQIP
ncbi:reverse transcriptase domain-containing protein, partial [Tanacetum coccineum]